MAIPGLSSGYNKPGSRNKWGELSESNLEIS